MSNKSQLLLGGSQKQTHFSFTTTIKKALEFTTLPHYPHASLNNTATSEQKNGANRMEQMMERREECYGYFEKQHISPVVLTSSKCNSQEFKEEKLRNRTRAKDFSYG